MFEVERDEQMIANILQIATAFYERMQRGEPQPITTYEEASRIFPQHVEKPIAATLQIAEACNEFRELKGAEKRVGDQLKTLQATLAAYLGEHDTLLVDGKPALTWRTQSSMRLDNEALKTECPDIYAQYTRSATSRVMRLKKAA